MVDGVARHGWSVVETGVDSPVSVDLVRRYFFDVASSFHGRAATDAEVDAAIDADHSDDLAPPTGIFLVGRYHGVPAGCAGLRFGAGFAELRRMFVVPDVRGTGGGATLLAAAEQVAAGHADTIRLDTRLDLTSARRLYETHGYRSVPAFSHGPYAEVWYAKALTRRA